MEEQIKVRPISASTFAEAQAYLDRENAFLTMMHTCGPELFNLIGWAKVMCAQWEKYRRPECEMMPHFLAMESTVQALISVLSTLDDSGVPKHQPVNDRLLKQAAGGSPEPLR